MTMPHRPRVLLADDYPGMLIAWQRLLEPSCEIVGSVSTGRSALDAVAQLEPEVIVLDIVLPDMTGFDACRAIRRISAGTGVILVTADDDPELRRAALEAGASAFVVKHTAVEELEVAIRRACEP